VGRRTCSRLARIAGIEQCSRKRRWWTKRFASLLMLLGGLAALLTLFGSTFASGPAGSGAALAATTFEVNDPANSGPGTLRQAILDANSTPGADVITFNLGSGTQTISPTSALPNLTETVTIDAGCTTPKAVELNGSLAGASVSGLATSSTGNVIRGLAINRFSNNGINVFTGSNRVECSHIGTDATGTIDRGNGNNGIDVSGNSNVIGGLDSIDGKGNVISGNSSAGIRVTNSTGNRIGDNLIGTDVGGNNPIANNTGVFLSTGASTTNIGVGGAAGNVISGNDFAGIDMNGGVVPTGNIVQGNYIGTDATGTAQLDPTPGLGIDVSDADNNTIGGGAGAPTNVISGNQIGIVLSSGASGNEVVGNNIGVTASGVGALGNTNEGIVVISSSSNTIGGTVAGAANVIGNNGSSGVLLRGGAGNKILRNSIHSNGLLGIDLGPGPAQGADGVTPNDTGDPDTGSNDRQNFPVLTSASSAGGTTTVNGSLNSKASRQYRLELFSSPACDASGNGEGRTFLGSQDVTTDAGGDVSFSVNLGTATPSGNVVTATATDLTTNDTSEFSACRSVSGGDPLTFTVNSTADTDDGSCTNGNCTLREAINRANAVAGTDTIGFSASGAIAPTSPLPTITDPAVIDAGISTTKAIELNGTNAGSNADGLRISAGNTVVRGLAINRFNRDGIRLENGGGNTIESNYLGTDPTGSIGRGNSQAIEINNSAGNVVGGSGTGAGNVISGSVGAGIAVQIGLSAMGNQIQGNLIGTDRTGSLSIANGVGVRLGSPNNVVGGTTPAARNVISGNGGGVLIGNLSFTDQSGNEVQGNYIGTDATGTVDLGNQGYGVAVLYAGNTIGGAASGAGNVISGNHEGVDLEATDTTVQGNLIGTNATGNADLGNDLRGVLLNQAGGNLIGGVTPGARNVISGNDYAGVQVEGGTGNRVQGNLVGTDGSGTAALGNSVVGVQVVYASGNTVGGTSPGEGNTIAYNGFDGVLINGISAPGTDNRVSSNSIHSNGNLGIDLGNDDGVTANDSGDGDGGLNNLQNYPTLTSATPGSSTTVTGTLDSQPGTYRLEFFSNATCDPTGFGEGQRFEGSENVTVTGGPAQFTAVLANTLPLDEFVTATATDASGNTSEFSECRVVAAAPPADLRIAKTDSPDPVIAGQQLTYTLTATNDGPSDADDVTITDDLPAALAGAQYCIGLACTPDTAWSGSVDIGTLANGASETVRITATVASGTLPGTISNEASVAGSVSDPSPANDSATENTDVAAEADIDLAKSAGPDQNLATAAIETVAGTQLVYALRVTNHGPSDARNVQITDNLPAPLTNPAYCLGEGCGNFTQPWTGSVNVGTVAGGGGTKVVRIRSLVPSDTPETTQPSERIANPASATTTTLETRSDNNSRIQRTTVLTRANIDVAKTAGPDQDLATAGIQAIAGTDLTYAIRVNNILGPSDARNVQITDNLPAPLTNAMYCLGEGCGNFTQPWTGSLNVGTIPFGGTVIVRIRARVPANTPPSNPPTVPRILNQVSASTTTTDPSTANNTRFQQTTVITRADLSVTKDDDPRPVIAGTTLSYTLTLHNDGPSDAQAAELRDTLPGQLTDARYCVGTDCDVTGSSPAWTGSVAFGVLIPGETREVHIAATVSPAALEGTVIHNEASKFTTTTDPLSSNNIAATDTPVIARAELGITKTDEPDSVTAGNTLRYTIIASNSGPSDAQDVFVRDNLPDELTGERYCIGVDCVIDGGSQPWTLDLPIGLLPAGGQVVINIEGQIDPGTLDGAIGNIAEVFSTTTDPGLVANSFHQDTDVVTRADLVLTKTDDPDPEAVVAGEGIAYDLKVTNTGPSYARQVRVTDALPAGLNSARYCVGANCVVDGSSDNWAGFHDFGTLTPGEERFIHIEATADPSVLEGTVIHNEGTASSTTTDDDLTDNTATTDTDVIAKADLSLDSKTDSADPDPIIAGTDLTYTIRFTNHGPSDAQSVTLTDSLPNELLGERFCTGDGCSVTGTSPAWTGATNLGKVPAGAERVVVITTQVNPSTPEGTVLHNEATVASTTTDPGPRANTATQDTNVITKADPKVLKSDDDPVIAGNQVTYTIEVTNDGPSDAQAMQVTDTLPSTLTNASYCTGSNCQTFTQAWSGSVALGVIPAGGKQFVRIRATVPPNTPPSPPTIDNTASASSSTFDPDLSNNADTEPTTVITRADLSITKGGPIGERIPGYAQVGDRLTYTLTAGNAGPSYAQSVTVADNLPSKLGDVRYCVGTGCAVSGSSPAWTGSINIGAIEVGGSREVKVGGIANSLAGSPFSFAAEPTGNFGPAITNPSGSVSSPTQDPSPSNNTSGSAGSTKVCTVLGTDAGETITGTAGNDWLCGRGGNDTMNGLGGNDVIQGDAGDDNLDHTNTLANYSAGDDILEGAEGSDLIDGGAGADRLNGGRFAESGGGDASDDTLTYQYASPSVSASLADGVATGAGNGAGDSIGKVSATDSTFENLTGTTAADELTGDEQANGLDGLGCTAAGSGCTSSSYLTVTPPLQSGDKLEARGGDDTLRGREGNDSLRAGDGNDTLLAGGGNDLLDGGFGDDSFNGQSGADIAWYLNAPVFNTTTNQGSAVNLAVTSAQATGKYGNDSFVEVENILGSLFNDTLSGDTLPNYISGAAGNDLIQGRAGNDFTLSGGDGNDDIRGQEGNDTLVGGKGKDSFNGGADTDACYVGSNNDFTNESKTQCEPQNKLLSGDPGGAPPN
jgi:CSLREA domain-containing protein/uncharacterized repeat protein (TIGR01451 family)